MRKRLTFWLVSYAHDRGFGFRAFSTRGKSAAPNMKQLASNLRKAGLGEVAFLSIQPIPAQAFRSMRRAEVEARVKESTK